LRGDACGETAIEGLNTSRTISVIEDIELTKRHRGRLSGNVPGDDFRARRSSDRSRVSDKVGGSELKENSGKVGKAGTTRAALARIGSTEGTATGSRVV
jgi:hypothetical protein